MTQAFLNGYQQLAHELAIYPQAMARHYLFPTLLVEAVTLYNAALDNNDGTMQNKAGDLLWFCSEIFTTLDVKFADYENYASTRVPQASYRSYIWAIVNHAREACRQWAKIVRDKNGLIDQYDIPKLLLPTSEIVRYIEVLAPELNADLRGIAESNLNRLAERKRRGRLATEETQGL
ncbi:MAG: hypothetical protein HXY40_01375 [Chloroflexi bacterium]|nr:hypothetical protein [Chloroflexota bacterium]